MFSNSFEHHAQHRSYPFAHQIPHEHPISTQLY